MQKAHKLTSAAVRRARKVLTLVRQSSIYADPCGSSPKVRRIYIASLLFYCCVTLFSAYHHECWRDEAYVWLMARDLSLPSLFTELRYNGSPGLWHVLVALLAKLNLPYESQQVLHWLVACVAAALFLFGAPFHPILKLLFLFSYFTLYEHVVIARVYSISILLLYVICLLYRNRVRFPFRYAGTLGLLANANFFGLIAATFFGAEYLFALRAERNWGSRHLLALAMMLTGGIVAAVSIYPPGDGLFYYQEHFSFFSPENIPLGLQIAFFGPEGWPYRIDWPKPLFGAAAFILSAILLLKLRAYVPALLVLIGWTTIIYLSVFKYLWPCSRHYSFFLIFLLIALWLAADNCTRRKVASIEPALLLLLTFTLLYSTYVGLKAVHEEIGGTPFSGSKDMALFIRSHKLEARTIVAYPDRVTASVLPYLPGVRYWYPQQERFGTYIHFHAQARRSLAIKKVGELAAARFGTEKVLFLFGDLKTDPAALGLELLHASPGSSESFSLYEKRH